MNTDAPDWARNGQDWPNREASQFVEAGGLTWHVQIAGQGPVVLLLHGTGASTHSWRDVLPRLAESFTVVAPDLPGHGFTSSPPPTRMSLPGMAASTASLLRTLGSDPAIAVGHSAGAAIAIWMTLERQVAPAGLISLNGALLPIGGIAGQVFSPLARTLAGSQIAANLFARWAGDAATVARLLRQTGSQIDARGVGLYQRLAARPAHGRAALAMMANWDLNALQRRLGELATPLLLVVGTRDGSIPPSDAETIKRKVRGATIERLRGLGHLAHEEDPAITADHIVRSGRAWGVLPPE